MNIGMPINCNLDVKCSNYDVIKLLSIEDMADFIIKACWGENNSKLTKNEVVAWLKQDNSLFYKENGFFELE